MFICQNGSSFQLKKQNIKKKILEKSGNFVNLEEWEPCIKPSTRLYRSVNIYFFPCRSRGKHGPGELTDGDPTAP